MIRFEPDTWREALLRPLAMAAPNSHVYVEIPAPDLRFVFIALLLVAWLLMSRRLRPGPRATSVLVVVLLLSFVPWLATSGNGRYFIPFLLATGPACIALAYRLPWSNFTKMTTAIVMLLLQGYIVFDNGPSHAWSLATWRDAPYFSVAVPADMKAAPATYVTITSISYSLIAPLFDSRSHWINVSSMMQDPSASIETRKARDIFANSSSLLLVVPSMPAYMTAEKLPNADLLDVIDGRLAPQRLAVARSQHCQLIPSKGLALVALGKLDKAKPETIASLGFWVCPLLYPAPPAPAPKRDATLDAIYEKIERLCPRYFPPGEAATRLISGGSVRDYASADMKLYVLDDGGVYYKYWRALNPELIAPSAKVMSPSFEFDCDHIRGRSGLPWERGI
jgi:hypothetical protein